MREVLSELIAEAQLNDSGLVRIPALSLLTDKGGNLYIEERTKRLALRRRPKIKRIVVLYQRIQKSLSELIWPF